MSDLGALPDASFGLFGLVRAWPEPGRYSHTVGTRRLSARWGW